MNPPQAQPASAQPFPTSVPAGSDTPPDFPRPPLEVLRPAGSGKGTATAEATMVRLRAGLLGRALCCLAFALAVGLGILFVSLLFGPDGGLG